MGREEDPPGLSADAQELILDKLGLLGFNIPNEGFDPEDEPLAWTYRYETGRPAQQNFGADDVVLEVSPARIEWGTDGTRSRVIDVQWLCGPPVPPDVSHAVGEFPLERTLLLDAGKVWQVEE